MSGIALFLEELTVGTVYIEWPHTRFTDSFLEDGPSRRGRDDGGVNTRNWVSSGTD